MLRYKNMFKKMQILNEGCFVPFVTIGDPSISVFYRIIDALIISGANALELGIPFSDPLADGIIVQNANLRALSHGITIIKCFEILNILRNKYPKIPIGILVYANIVFKNGINKFYENCKYSGIDSVLIPDVPIEESEIFQKCANNNNISSVFICPPNANTDLIKKLSIQSTEYIYLISRTGVTGCLQKTNDPNLHIIQKLKTYNSAPILHGFGISTPSQIKKSLSLGTSGIICGSIIIDIIDKFQKNNNIMIKKIVQLAVNLKYATKKTKK
ncbi:Tryptophan synthase alpha chain [Buchnera aphidicola (Takecallis arundicolens)]|uniref:tryptophan synthase subunit alpha n=1 Tax=Buchnera aphidicola TaxID=9 RepID=UPI0034638D76